MYFDKNKDNMAKKFQKNKNKLKIKLFYNNQTKIF